MDPSAYWSSVPKQYRDPTRYVVHRVIGLAFTSTKPSETIKVHDVANGARVGEVVNVADHVAGAC